MLCPWPQFPSNAARLRHVAELLADTVTHAADDDERERLQRIAGYIEREIERRQRTSETQP